MAAVQTPIRKREPKDFVFGRLLGEGSYASVLRATEKATGREFAIKVLDQKFIVKENKVKYVFIERDVLNSTNHPFIVKLFYTFQSATSLYFAMELAPNGDLLGLLRTRMFSSEAALFYASEIMVAMDYLHSCGILHRDLKPENVLITSDYHIKLCDFGSAKILSRSEPQPAAPSPQSPASPESDAESATSPPKQQNSFVGTAEYCSPELLNDRQASAATDVWSLGCILFYLHASRPPFKGANDYQTFQRILALKYEFPADGFSEDAKEVIKRIFVLTPTDRISVAELKQLPYFSGIEDWDSLHLRKAPELPVTPKTPAKERFHFSEDELASWYGKSLNVQHSSENVTQESVTSQPIEAVTPDSSEDSIRYPYELEDGIEDSDSPFHSQEMKEIIKVDPNQEREEALSNQRSSVLAHLLKDNELVLMVGTVRKRSGVFTKTMGLLLTDYPSNLIGFNHKWLI
ncbi:3-phosphoinositide dependent protein kinase-1 [Rhizoclosmatium sp. JEL0117]|nr:3-phosphoinositide dependent protein kinase-1 [Rhizoclosmatium sp. JEL0117]